MEKCKYNVIQVTYPKQEKLLIRSFENLRDADNLAFSLNMNRTSGKVEFITELDG